MVRSKPADPTFVQCLLDERIVTHPWVHGELLLAGLSASTSRDLLALAPLSVASQADVERFIRRYHPQGIGWVDVNLLVSCLDAGVLLWTNDRDLCTNARLHGRTFTPVGGA